MTEEISYGDAIRIGFEYLLGTRPDVFVMGQGVWSPWYVGNSMTDLDKKFGRERVIDTPVSEAACTGAAIGASLFGHRAVVVHPRMDFMVLATDPIVNQAAKWAHMLGGLSRPAVTIRGIVNRGGEQGAQHSQALHSWYAHIPGLRVVMPATPTDARDLLIAAVLCDDPVLYIDDRWLYAVSEPMDPPADVDLRDIRPVVRRTGGDVTLVAAGHSWLLAETAAADLAGRGIQAEVIDLRVVNPLDHEVVAASVAKTGRLVAIDGGWRTCGLAGEVIAGAAERLDPAVWRSRPVRIALPDAPAPTSRPLEATYYPTAEHVTSAVLAMVEETPAAGARTARAG